MTTLEGWEEAGGELSEGLFSDNFWIFVPQICGSYSGGLFA